MNFPKGGSSLITLLFVFTGRDCIGCAKTGSGKTAAFALPILQKLSEDPYGIYALVLTPTRELAFQIGDQFKALGKPIQVRVTVVTGGRGEFNDEIILMLFCSYPTLKNSPKFH